MKTKRKDQPYCGVSVHKIYHAKPEFLPGRPELFLTYIKRRYRIHLKKDYKKLPAPWTSDPILQEYRFTNIRREHDRESLWLIKHISTNPDLSYANKIYNTILFRLFNKHETSELIGQPIDFSEYDSESYRSVFKDAEAQDPKRVFFTGAFNTGGLKQGLQKLTHEDYTPMRLMKFMDDIIGRPFIIDRPFKVYVNQKSVYNNLKNLSGIGNFLAYQIFVDLTYIPEFPFSENEFTIAGPGCKKGINELFSGKDGMTDEECIFWLRDNWMKFNMIAPASARFNPVKRMIDLPEDDRVMNVMSLENCFCEFSKYVRAYTETGRPRKKYRQNDVPLEEI